MKKNNKRMKTKNIEDEDTKIEKKKKQRRTNMKMETLNKKPQR